MELRMVVAPTSTPVSSISLSAGALGHLFLEVFLAGEIFPAELSEHIVVFGGLSDLLEAAEADHALDMVPPVARLFLWLSENCETRFVTSS